MFFNTVLLEKMIDNYIFSCIESQYFEAKQINHELRG